MKLKDVLNIKNIKSFIEGNIRYFEKERGNLEPHIEEQLIWRMSKCQEDCVILGKCIKCGCPTEKKLLATESCNPNRHVKMMNKKDWEKFKIDNGIE